MFRVWGLLFVIVCTFQSAVAVRGNGVFNGFDARLCAAKKGLFKSSTYNLKTNRPNVRYYEEPNSTLTITNTMTFEAEISWHFIKLLCIRYYCLSNVNLDRSAKGYKLYKNYGWFKLYSELKNWNSAHSRCVEDGATLAVPNTIRAKMIIMKVLKKNNTEQAWIGVHDMYVEGVLVDAKDRLYHRTNIYFTNGHNTDDKDCLFVKTEEKIDYTECAQTNLPFVCEFTD